MLMNEDCEFAKSNAGQKATLVEVTQHCTHVSRCLYSIIDEMHLILG
jgi:hypothetical protein